MAAAFPGRCPVVTAGSIFEDGIPINFDDILELPDLDTVLTEARGSDSASPDRANPQTFNAGIASTFSSSLCCKRLQSGIDAPVLDGESHMCALKALLITCR